MAELPGRPEQNISQLVYRAVERSKKRGWYLARLGASGIGRECLRRVFYDWRGYTKKETEGRMQILFETGDIYEKRIVEWLRMTGMSIWDKDPKTGKQFDYAHPSGHFTVRIDGVARGVLGFEKDNHLLEVKSHNDNQFSQLEKHGVARSHPEHYIQCQMGMDGMGLNQTLYVGMNKNDEQMHFERIMYDSATVDKIEAKIKELVEATLTPAGISLTASAPGCRFCPHKMVCVGKEAPVKNCRTCRMGNPGPQGSWICGLDGSILEYKKQMIGCNEYDARQEGIPAGSYLQSG
jgi:hypothetical protein